MRSGNSDIAIMNRPFAFRLAALLPLYNAEAAVGIRSADISRRRREITHQFMSYWLGKWDSILNKVIELQCADGVVRSFQPFLHFNSMDLAEVAQHCMTNVRQCHKCTIQASDLDRTDLPLVLRSPEKVRKTITKNYEWTLIVSINTIYFN